ncbi:MAG: hypothetical protein EOP81_02350 [Variovorax sp.]|nr:MAG: hypothetical protein EOP81_02350 [Variovorax sp.]
MAYAAYVRNDLDDLMRLRLFALLGLALLAACGTFIDTQPIQRHYDEFSAQVERHAAAGQITWVAAQSSIRNLDRDTKTKLDSTGSYHSWRYDIWDDEYHAYTISLADQLDRKQISFYQFDAARKQRWSEIENRRIQLGNQRALIDAAQQRRRTNCTSSAVGLAPFQQIETTCN